MLHVLQHSDVLNNGEGVGDIMMERDSLKVKLAECESQLQAFHVQYEEEHKDDQEQVAAAAAASPTSKDAAMGRSRNLSMSSNPMSRSWRDHRNALESELERCERELEEVRADKNRIPHGRLSLARLMKNLILIILDFAQQILIH